MFMIITFHFTKTQILCVLRFFYRMGFYIEIFFEAINYSSFSKRRWRSKNNFLSWFSIKFKNSYKISFGLSFLFSASHCDFLNFSSKENTSKMLAPTPRSISRSSLCVMVYNILLYGHMSVIFI